MMVIMGYISTTAASVASKEEQVVTLKVNAILSTTSKTELTFPVVSHNAEHFRHCNDSNNDVNMLSYEQELIDNSQSHIVNAGVSHDKKFVTKGIDNEFVMYMYSQNLSQCASKHEVFSHNVSQNVFNLVGRHVCALQSNSNSVQDGGWSNNGGGTHREGCVIAKFASMTKTECPGTSGGIAVSHNTLNCKNYDNLHSYQVQFTNWYQMSDNYNAYIVYIQQFLHEIVSFGLLKTIYLERCTSMTVMPFLMVLL